MQPPVGMPNIKVPVNTYHVDGYSECPSYSPPEVSSTRPGSESDSLTLVTSDESATPPGTHVRLGINLKTASTHSSVWNRRDNGSTNVSSSSNSPSETPEFGSGAYQKPLELRRDSNGTSLDGSPTNFNLMDLESGSAQNVPRFCRTLSRITERTAAKPRMARSISRAPSAKEEEKKVDEGPSEKANEASDVGSPSNESASTYKPSGSRQAPADDWTDVSETEETPRSPSADYSENSPGGLAPWQREGIEKQLAEKAKMAAMDNTIKRNHMVEGASFYGTELAAYKHGKELRQSYPNGVPPVSPHKGFAYPRLPFST